MHRRLRVTSELLAVLLPQMINLCLICSLFAVAAAGSVPAWYEPDDFVSPMPSGSMARCGITAHSRWIDRDSFDRPNWLQWELEPRSPPGVRERSPCGAVVSYEFWFVESNDTCWSASPFEPVRDQKSHYKGWRSVSLFRLALREYYTRELGRLRERYLSEWRWVLAFPRDGVLYPNFSEVIADNLPARQRPVLV